MVEDLIRRARRRFLLNETLAQTAFAAAVAIGGFALLLIVGTRYMQWWTLGIFAAVGIAIGSWRVYKRTPDPYTAAVKVDEHARLHDALSTALYFSEHPKGSAAFLDAQRKQADATAGSVRLEEAMPFVVPRSLYAMATLCVLASVLIALRFGAGHGMDLHAPLTQFIIEDQAAQTAQNAKNANPKSQKQWMQEAQSLLSKLGTQPNPNEPAPGDPDSLEKALEQALQNPSDSATAGDKGGQSGRGGQTKEGASDQTPNGDPLDNAEDANADKNAQQGSESKAGDKNGKPSAGKNANPGKQEGLLSRLKDALSNMVSTDRNEAGAQQGQQTAKNDAAKPPGQPNQKSQSQSDAQTGQPDADGQSGQQSQGKMSSKSDSQPGKGGSGVGSENGSKEIKEAAQLKAMGKISEIIGQRAATVSGETSVEVQSGDQKLRTDYSNTAATHGETDGDVTRDEIPLAVQAYVQQYFEQVRKAKPQTKAPAGQ